MFLSKNFIIGCSVFATILNIVFYMCLNLCASRIYWLYTEELVLVMPRISELMRISWWPLVFCMLFIGNVFFALLKRDRNLSTIILCLGLFGDFVMSILCWLAVIMPLFNRYFVY